MNNISSTHKPLKIGTVLENRYKITKLIKASGMGAVYKALDERLNSICAVKELLTDYEDETEQSKEWFLREARILAQLDHPNLPKVSDYFSHKDRYYLVMTLIDGEEMEDILKREGNPALNEDKVIDWAIQILKILEYLHSQDPPIIYRDIKPANIIIHKDGRAILIDFGLARTIAPKSNTIKTSIGTPAFAPVELFYGKPEIRSDIYSLGATMHYLLTGEYPLPLLFGPIREINPRVSKELESIVLKSLEKAADDRFQSAREMREAIEKLYLPDIEREKSSVIIKEIDSKVPHAPLKVGTVLENRYKIMELIKARGMGVVYKALDERLNNICAVKELITDYEEETEQEKEWFLREARILAQLDHPNLPKVSDYFLHKDRYYLVMTFIEGEEIEKILEREGNPGLNEEKVIDWAIQILKILEYLHNQDPPIIYRDIKPANIMIHKDGRAILIDFSLARTIALKSNTTKTCTGTPAFSPVELFYGKPEIRSDMYSLGATMHYLLTGEYPLPLLFEPIRETNPLVSKELDAIVLKSVEKAADDRFQSAGEMREAIENLHLPDRKKTSPVTGEEIDKKPQILSVDKIDSTDKIKKINVLLTGLVLVITVIVIFSGILPSLIYKKGLALKKDGKYDEAIQYFNRALSFNPFFKFIYNDKKEALTSKGDLMARKGNYKESLAYYNRALEINPHESALWYKRANVLNAMGKYDESIKLCDEVLKDEPNCGYALFNKGISLYLQKKYEKSKECLNKFCLSDLKDFNLKVRDLNGCTPLHRAAEIGHKGLAEILISHGANVNAEDNKGKTPLHHSSMEGNKELIKLLLKKGALINEKDKSGRIPLHDAVYTGKKEAVKLLIDGNANLNAMNNDGETPLHLAVKEGKKDIVELLIKEKAQLSLKNKNGETPFVVAGKYKRNEIILLFNKYNIYK